TDYAFLEKISEYAVEPLSESNVTPASKSLKLSANIDLTTSVVAFKHDEEMGMFVVLDDVVDLAGVGSRHVSFGPYDVVVALFTGEKGDGLTLSSVASEDVKVNPSRRILSHATRPKPNGFPMGSVM
nr:hypothetical protein [Tanacetum cinerariifolium]